MLVLIQLRKSQKEISNLKVPKDKLGIKEKKTWLMIIPIASTKILKTKNYN
jgi:hypothetical protein